jgi:glycosyltransferase involved in cell wall biosynthesis
MNLLIPHDFEANYVLGFARGLAANGVEFTVVSSDEIEERLSAAGIAQCNLRGSLDPARPVWRKAANLVRYYLLLSWTIFRHRGGTIHFNGLLTSRIILFDGLFLPAWIRLWSGRYIHTAHNVLPHSRENSILFRRMYRWIYLFPNLIIAHTAKVARQLESEFGVDPTRIAVISIGLNQEIADTDLSVAESRRQLGLPTDGPIAIFFGKLEPYKGVDILAEAWGKVRNPAARLFITGWCPDAAYAETVRSAIGRSLRAATMQWREGFVPNELAAVWLKACDVVVMPYRNIYQSGVVFLCLRFGVPIVATNVGSLAEFVDSESGIIARTNDSEGIAGALDQFFSAPARFQRDKIALRAAKYAWDRQCFAIKHLYR